MDRIRPPLPDGIELYLAAEDLAAGDGAMAERIRRYRPAPDFAYVVEGPLRSLDGRFFDVTVDNGANREVLRRLVSLGRQIGAEAVVIHAIACRETLQELEACDREAVLGRSLGFLQFYTELCAANGLTATIENVPPVAFMREARPSFSLLGVAPEDMIALCDAVPGLRITLDVSHAQLYINAANCQLEEVPPGLRHLAAFWHRRRSVAGLDGYIEAVEGYLFEAHLSNARGITGEGLGCYDGELDLGALGRRLARDVRFLVTETIEPDPDHAVLMREVQRCLKTALVA
ncbi:MAG: sugar phosphate isomerase/epimerase [Chloroflexi bacterium]|nr:sugar phosphate isomerase/epimerase [Chloroflexota bacterium]MCL5026622.1 sugar phosphate isomerase/epimerase [Chloroflexota bacterium]